MENDRIIEAIVAHDPDGQAFKRVREAAYITLNDFGSEDGLYTHAGDHCLLAHAWKAEEVDNGSFKDHLGRDRCHSYKEVVHWFDSFNSHQDAAKEVLNIIPEAETGVETIREEERETCSI